MDAKKYLSRAFELNRDLRFKERQLDRLKGTVPYSSPRYGDVKIDTNIRHSAVEYTAIRFVALSDEIKETAEELASLMKEIETTIKRVGDSEVEAVLEMRYLSFMNWDEIADSLGYSVRHIFRLHRIGLKRVGSYV